MWASELTTRQADPVIAPMHAKCIGTGCEWPETVRMFLRALSYSWPQAANSLMLQTMKVPTDAMSTPCCRSGNVIGSEQVTPHTFGLFRLQAISTVASRSASVQPSTKGIDW